MPLVRKVYKATLDRRVLPERLALRAHKAMWALPVLLVR